jgi:hypothetical protein
MEMVTPPPYLEHWLCEDARDAAASPADAIRQSDCVLVLPDVVSSEECATIARAASLAAAEVRETRVPASGLPADAHQGMIRLLTQPAGARAQVAGVPHAEPLPDAISRLCDEILVRVAQIIDKSLPSIPSSLFGGGDATLLCDLLLSDKLTFSSREPGVNVYAAGGQFMPHKDHQALTVLIPLSDPGSFTGGGTSFWSQDARGPRVEGPSITLRPPAGSVMLFGGHVTHAGVAVDEGERVVYVASFSPPGGRAQRAEEAARSRDVYGDLLS